MNFIMSYFFIINLIAIMAMALDKSAARNDDKRVRESSLFSLAFLGGGLGVYFSMYAFHHKTRKNRFKYGIPAITLLNIAVGLAIFFVFFR